MEVRKPSIFRRLTERLGLEPGPMAPSTILVPMVSMAIDLGELLRDIDIKYFTEDPGATGTRTIYTVEDDKRMWLYGYTINRTVGTTLTHDSLGLWKVGGGDYRQDLDSYTAAASRFYLFPRPVPMKEKWYITLSITAYAAGDEYKARLLVEEEDAY